MEWAFRFDDACEVWPQSVEESKSSSHHKNAPHNMKVRAEKQTKTLKGKGLNIENWHEGSQGTGRNTNNNRRWTDTKEGKNCLENM